MPYRVEATFPAAENALWWRDQLIGDYPELTTTKVGALVIVGPIDDRTLAEDLATEAYTRYSASNVDVDDEVQGYRSYQEW